MAPSRSHEPLWLGRSRARRPAYPRFRGAASADVAIVGGGAVGCLSAHAFASAGCSVVLLEADRVGGAATAGADGALVPGPGTGFRDLRDRLGLRAARHVWESSRRATLDLMALLRRLRIQCELQPMDHLELAHGEARVAALDRDYQALREAGLDASWLGPSRVRPATGLAGAEALKLAGGGAVDPYKACLGLVRHAERLGAAVFEHSPVRRVRFGRRSVEVATDGGTVTASRVVVASGLPGPGFGALHRHLRLADECVVAVAPLPARLRRGFGEGRSVVADGAGTIRWHFTRDGHLLVRGPLQAAVAHGERAALTVAHTARLMYELSLRYHDVSGVPPARGWLVRAVTSPNGVPVAGPHRNYPRHLFATALGHGGLGAAYLASRVLLRAHAEAPDKGDELFGFIR